MSGDSPLKTLSSLEIQINSCIDLKRLHEIQRELDALTLKNQEPTLSKRFSIVKGLLDTKATKLQQASYKNELLESLKKKFNDLDKIVKKIPINTTNRLEIELLELKNRVNQHILLVSAVGNISKLPDPVSLTRQTEQFIKKLSTRITLHEQLVLHRANRCDELEEEFKNLDNKFQIIIENQEINPNLFQNAQEITKKLDLLTQRKNKEISIDAYIRDATTYINNFDSIFSKFIKILASNLRKKDVQNYIEKKHYIPLRENIKALSSEHLFSEEVLILKGYINTLDVLANRYIDGNDYDFSTFSKEFKSKLNQLLALITPSDKVMAVTALYQTIVDKIQSFPEEQLTQELKNKHASLAVMYQAYTADKVQWQTFTNTLLLKCQKFVFHLAIAKLTMHLDSVLEVHRDSFYYNDLALIINKIENIYHRYSDEPESFEMSQQAMIILVLEFDTVYEQYQQFSERFKQYEAHTKKSPTNLESTENEDELLRNQLNPEYLYTALNESLSTLGVLCKQHLDVSVNIETFLADFDTEQKKFLLIEKFIETHHTQIIRTREMILQTTNTLHDKTNLHARLETELTESLVSVKNLIHQYAREEIAFDRYQQEFETASNRHAQAVKEFEDFYPLYKKYVELNKAVSNLQPTTNEKKARHSDNLRIFLQGMIDANIGYGIQYPKQPEVIIQKEQEEAAPPQEGEQPENKEPLILNFSGYQSVYNYYLPASDSSLEFLKAALAQETAFLTKQIQKLRDHDFSVDEVAAKNAATETAALMQAQVDAYKNLLISKEEFKKNLDGIIKTAQEGPLKDHRGWKEFIINTGLFIVTIGIGYAIGMFFTGRSTVIPVNTTSINLTEEIQRTVTCI